MTPTLAPRELPAVERANGGRIAAGVVLVVVEILLIAGLAIGLFVGVSSQAGIVASMLGVIALVADLCWHLQTGHGVAWRLAGVRQLATVDDSPLGLRRAFPPMATWLATVRGRRDPIDVRADLPDLSPASSITGASSRLNRPGAAFPGQPSAAAAQGAGHEPQASPRLDPLPPGMQFAVADRNANHAQSTHDAGYVDGARHHGGPVRVTVDGQARHQLAGTAVVGRRPNAGTSGASEITVTDLERTLSKNHLLLTLADDGIISVTDLGSTNGSEILDEVGVTTTLVAHEPVPLERGDVVILGGHRLTFGNPTPTGVVA